MIISYRVNEFQHKWLEVISHEGFENQMIRNILGHFAAGSFVAGTFRANYDNESLEGKNYE